MIDTWHAIILGAIQGATEILPISSSAHLVLFPWFFDFDYQGLAFDVALHLGTLLAILLFFWRDWVGLLVGAWQFISGKLGWSQNYQVRLLVWLSLATIPGALIGYFLEGQAETVFRSPILIAGTLFMFALVLWRADRKGSKNISLPHSSFKKLMTIGLAQALAIVPGVSRSGITMTAGLFVGLTKKDSARFSFLLAAPIIFGAGLVEAPKALAGGLNAPLVFGFLSAFVVGIFSIWLLLKIIQKTSFSVFVWYRILLALVILIFWLAD